MTDYHILDHLMEGCQIIGFDWRYLYLNEAAVRHGQQSRESLLGYTMMERYPGIETTGMFALLRRCMEDRTVERMENEFVYPDGTKGWFELSIQPVPEGLFILSLEVTERKLAEQELEALYNATSYLFQADSLKMLAEQVVETVVREFEHADCGLMLVDADDHTISRIARAGVYDVHPIGDLTLDGPGLVPLAIRTGSTVHVPDVMLDGNYLASDSRTRSELVVPLQTARGVIGALDLQRTEPGAFSERDQRILAAYAERAAFAIEDMQLYEQVNAHAADLENRVLQRTAELVYAKQRVEAILNNSVDAIVLADADFRIRQTNAAFNRLFACQSQDYFSQPLAALTIPDNVSGFMPDRAALTESYFEFRARRKDGSTFEAEFTLGVVKTEGVVCTIRDVTGRKRAEAALRESEEKFRQLVKAAPIAVVMTDSAGQIMLFNDQAEILFGYDRDELMGQPVERLLPEAIRETHVHHRTGYMAAPHTRQMGIGLELLARRKDGSQFAVEIQLGYIEMQTGLMVMSFIADITERKKSEAALQAKMKEELAFQNSLKTLHDITIDLTLIDDLNDFYKCAVMFGLDHLGFERLGLLLYDSERELAVGTYGTDMHGQLTPEHGLSLAPSELTGILARSWTEDERVVIDENAQLFSNLKPIGTGWNAVAVLSHGSEKLGWLAADNGIHQRPLTKALLDILSLYALTLGTLLARKQAEAALSASLEAEREFQNYLKALHEITIELSEIDLLDTFYQRAITVGLQHLGHERLAIFLYDAESETAIGTFGTDLEGNVIDERYVQFTPSPTGIMLRAFERNERFAFRENSQLSTATVEGGIGWNAAAVLWNGEEKLGWLIADNAISHHPATKPQLDILGLYALTLGSLMAGKRIQSDLSMSEARYRLLADNATDLVMQSNTAAEFVYVSPSVYAMLGYEPAELLGLSALEFVHPDDMVTTQKALARTLEPDLPNVQVTLRFRHKTGPHVWLEVIGQAIHSSETGEPQGFIAAGRDITERKAAEDALRRALEKEQELGELKSRFVSMASHEFRTPLATILALTETVIAYRKRLTDEQLDERLIKIQEQIGHLKDIMEDVLQLARLQARRMEFNPVLLDLDSLCRSVLHEFESRTDVTQRLAYNCDGVLHAVVLDKKLMRQIINNLMSNAVKYSPPDSTVIVALSVDENDLVLRVQDEGIGIPEPDLKHLFTPFHRAANVGTISGTGLGLVIVKESVELHGGTIEVESKIGVGTTFTVTIPMMKTTLKEG